MNGGGLWTWINGDTFDYFPSWSYEYVHHTGSRTPKTYVQDEPRPLRDPVDTVCLELAYP